MTKRTPFGAAADPEVCWSRRQHVQSRDNHGKNFTRAQVERRQAQPEESEIAATSSPETLASYDVAIAMTLQTAHILYESVGKSDFVNASRRRAKLPSPDGRRLAHLVYFPAHKNGSWPMMATQGSRYRWRVGEIEITRVLEFEAALFEPAVIHPDVTPELIERHRSWLEPTLMNPASGLMVFSFHSTVIRTPDAIILVDTCSGNDKERPHKSRYHRKNWPYLANLAAAGFAPEDINYVLCTHLHADHVGWNTRLLDGRWVPTFPNARYLFARQEWEYWQHAELRAGYTTDPYYEDSLLPVMESGQAQLVASDYAFDDSVWIEPWPGHTPGHVCVVARSSRASVILSGDIMHTALQCAEPQLNSCFCVDAEAARTARRRFLETFADSPVMVIPSHFPTPTAGWIRSHGRLFRFHFDRHR